MQVDVCGSASIWSSTHVFMHLLYTRIYTYNYAFFNNIIIRQEQVKRTWLSNQSMVGCVFRDMVRAGVVPVGEGVMRLSSTNDASREYVLDVLEDGRIRWCDELSSSGEVFQSPLACCAKIWNIAAPQRYYERILVSCANKTEARTLKELKDEFVASKTPCKDVSCQDTSGVSEHDTGSCGIQEYNAVIPTWSDRGPRSSGLMAECVGDVGMVHGRKCRKRPSCADSGDATHTPQQRDVHREREEEEDYDDGLFECGLEEEVTVCQPVGGIEHDTMRHDHDGVKVGSGMLDMVRVGFNISYSYALIYTHTCNHLHMVMLFL